MKYICPKGHKYSITWKHWKKGVRCPHSSGHARLTINFVRHEFEKRGYTLLSKEYINSRLTLKFKCEPGHIGKMLWDNFKRGAICLQCSIENKSGSGHPNWKGGISKDPYCQNWGKDLREFVKERDGFKCLNPYCSGKDVMISVHHINYNKKSCGPENLITVCRSCNGRANKDRNWHQAWYQAILNKRYGYVY